MKTLYSLLFIALFSLPSFAQIGLDISAKGQFNSTWLFNQKFLTTATSKITRQAGEAITVLD